MRSDDHSMALIAQAPLVTPFGIYLFQRLRSCRKHCIFRRLRIPTAQSAEQLLLGLLASTAVLPSESRLLSDLICGGLMPTNLRTAWKTPKPLYETCAHRLRKAKPDAARGTEPRVAHLKRALLTVAQSDRNELVRPESLSTQWQIRFA
jgi:hypothetical protein